MPSPPSGQVQDFSPIQSSKCTSSLSGFFSQPIMSPKFDAFSSPLMWSAFFSLMVGCIAKNGPWSRRWLHRQLSRTFYPMLRTPSPVRRPAAAGDDRHETKPSAQLLAASYFSGETANRAASIVAVHICGYGKTSSHLTIPTVVRICL
jgi:hypothetical protein